MIGRYRLIIRVVDPAGNTTFTLFNKDVECLRHVPIETIVQENQVPYTFFPKLRNNLIFHFTKCIIQTILKANPPADILEVLNHVFDQTCAFDVKITGYNTNLGYEEYTVVKLPKHNSGENQTVAKPNRASLDEVAALEANIAYITNIYLLLLNKTCHSTIYAYIMCRFTGFNFGATLDIFISCPKFKHLSCPKFKHL